MIHYLQLLMARFIMGFLNLIPYSISSWFVKIVGSICYLLFPKRRKIALSNLDLVFGDSMQQKTKNRIARQSFQNGAISVLELFLMNKMVRNKEKLFEIEGFENVGQAFQKGKGIILALSHLGSWEYMGYLATLNKGRTSVLVKSLKHSLFNKEIVRLRKKTDLHSIPNQNAIREILSELHQNHMIGILMDQWAGDKGIWTSFFDEKTSTTSMPVRLVKKTGAVLMPAYCLRKKAGKYKIIVEKEVSFDFDKETWERDATEKLNRILEEKIRQYPEQWNWSHRRWKPDPGDTRQVA